MSDEPLTIGEINRFDRATFVERLGRLFEGEPWMVAAAWDQRPFADRAALHEALMCEVERAGRIRQEGLIRAHPDLVGRAALAGTLTRESTGEQVAAGLDPGRLTAQEIARFGALNDAYAERFGFPFVICARGNSKATILAAMTARLENDQATEITTAIGEIGKICRLRLDDLVAE